LAKIIPLYDTALFLELQEYFVCFLKIFMNENFTQSFFLLFSRSAWSAWDAKNRNKAHRIQNSLKKPKKIKNRVIKLKKREK